jgi:hypothetical protein
MKEKICKKKCNFKNIVAISKANKNLLRSFISKGITTFLSYLETTICFLAHKFHSMYCHFFILGLKHESMHVKVERLVIEHLSAQKTLGITFRVGWV